MSKTVHCTDSKSLWNNTLSPGWTQKEIEVLRFALMKYGVGNWRRIIQERILPGKTNSQLVGQTQRLLGQQSLKEFNRLHIDPLKVAERNIQRTNALRKSGLIINAGDCISQEEIARKVAQNQAEFGLSPEEIAAVRIPTLREFETSNVIVDSTVRNAASVRDAALQRLAMLHTRLEQLNQQLVKVRTSPSPMASSRSATPSSERGLKRKPSPAAGAASAASPMSAEGTGVSTCNTSPVNPVDGVDSDAAMAWQLQLAEQAASDDDFEQDDDDDDDVDADGERRKRRRRAPASTPRRA